MSELVLNGNGGDLSPVYLHLYFYWYLYLSVINDEISHLCASLLVKTQAEQMRHHRVCPI